MFGLCPIVCDRPKKWYIYFVFLLKLLFSTIETYCFMRDVNMIKTDNQGEGLSHEFPLKALPKHEKKLKKYIEPEDTENL